MRRTRAIGPFTVGVCATLAVLVLWLAFARQPNAATPAAPAIELLTAVSEPNPAGPPPVAPLLAELSPTAADTGRKPVNDAPNVAPDARIVLRGCIESVRTDLDRAEVRVRRPGFKDWNVQPRSPIKMRLLPGVAEDERDPRLIAAVKRDGCFEVDITHIASLTEALVVSGRHPDLQTVSVRLSTEPVSRARAGEAVALSTTLVMNAAACRARGQAITDGGSPAEISVVAFQLRGESLLAQPIGEQLCGDDGSFELELVPGVEYAVVAYAEGRRPETRSISCPDSAAADLGVLIVGRGVSISGQVLLGSAPFGKGVTVSAELTRPMPLVSVGPTSFAWCAGRFEWPRRTTRADELGMYELDALGPYEYSIHASGTSAGFLLDQPIATYAPAIDADIVPSVFELHVEIHRGGEPAPGELFLVRDRVDTNVLTTRRETDSAGRATLWLPSDRMVEVVVNGGTPRERSYAVSGAVNDSLDLRIDL